MKNEKSKAPFLIDHSPTLYLRAACSVWLAAVFLIAPFERNIRHMLLISVNNNYLTYEFLSIYIPGLGS
jgi:hypothetical protein